MRPSSRRAQSSSTPPLVSTGAFRSDFEPRDANPRWHETRTAEEVALARRAHKIVNKNPIPASAKLPPEPRPGTTATGRRPPAYSPLGPTGRRPHSVGSPRHSTTAEGLGWVPPPAVPRPILAQSLPQGAVRPSNALGIPSASLLPYPATRFGGVITPADMTNDLAVRELAIKAQRMADRLQGLEAASEAMREAGLASSGTTGKAAPEWADRLNSTFGNISTALNSLHTVFFADEAKLREAAIVTIQAYTRGFLVRFRRRKALEALRGWRRRQLAALQDPLADWIRRREVVHTKMGLMDRRRCRRLLRAALSGWSRWTRSVAPVRNECRRNAFVLIQRRIRERTMLVFRRWFEVATGPRNRRHMLEAYRARHSRAAARLRAMKEDAGWEGEITEEMIKKEMANDAIAMMQKRHPISLVIQIMGSWRLYAKERRAKRAKRMKAMRHSGRRALKNAIRAWHRTVDTIKKWEGIKFNEKRNALVAIRQRRVLLLQKTLRAWAGRVRLLKDVGRRFAEHQKAWKLEVLRAFRLQCRRNRQLELITIERWLSVGKMKMQIPFRAWFLYALDRRLRRKAQEKLMLVMEKRRARRAVVGSWARWRQYVAEAKAPPEATREELARSLAEQRALNEQLVKTAGTFEQAVNDARRTAEGEAASRKQLAEELKAKGEEIVKLRFALQTAEGELMKMRAGAEYAAMLRNATADEPAGLADARRIADRIASEVAVMKGEPVRGRGAAPSAQAAASPFANAPSSARPDSRDASSSVAAPSPGPSGRPGTSGSMGAGGAGLEGASPRGQRRISAADYELLNRMKLLLIKLFEPRDRYAPPAAGGTEADAELRRVMGLLVSLASRPGSPVRPSTAGGGPTAGPAAAAAAAAGSERPPSASARPDSGRPGSAASAAGSLFAGPAEQSRPIKWNDFVQGIEAYESSKAVPGKAGARARLAGRIQDAKDERQRAGQPEAQARPALFAPPGPSRESPRSAGPAPK